MMGRSHDYYCHGCEVHYSPFSYDACPACGIVGTYDVNGDLPHDGLGYEVDEPWPVADSPKEDK